jgi:hypothetical protein
MCFSSGEDTLVEGLQPYDRLVDVVLLVRSHAHDAIAVAKEVASKMIGDRTCTLEFKLVLVHKNICDALGILALLLSPGRPHKL